MLKKIFTKERIKTILILVIPLIALLGIVKYTNMHVLTEGDYKNEFYRAKVTKITNRYITNNSTDTVNVSTKLIFNAKILNGPRKGETVIGFQYTTDAPDILVTPDVEEGDIVFLDTTSDDVGYQFLLFDSSNDLLNLGIVFLFAIVLFGGFKGFKTIYTLILTCLIVTMGFIPGMLSGLDAMLWSGICTIYIIFSTLLILNGLSKKSLCAILSCLGGSTIVFILSSIMLNALHLTGSVEGSAAYLKALVPALDFHKLIMAGALFGATGAIMDVAVELSASLKEIYDKAKDNSKTSLIASGFNIGKDMMGTMSNTLVMAYIGGSLISVLGVARIGYNIRVLFSVEMIAVEVLQILIGSFALLATIPITTIICAFVYTHKKNDKSAVKKKRQLKKA